MSYWIVHRNYLQQHYHDSVILDQNDINELYLLARQSSTRKQKDTNK